MSSNLTPRTKRFGRFKDDGLNSTQTLQGKAISPRYDVDLHQLNYKHGFLISASMNKENYLRLSDAVSR